MQLIRLISTLVPLVMAGLFLFVLVKLLTPARPRSVAPFAPGQFVTLHALLLADAQPGTVVSLGSLAAPSGRITLTAFELIWAPDAPGPGAWRCRLTDVRVVERPSFATRRLVLRVQDRMIGLVVDPKRRPNRFSRNTVAERREAETAAWLADLIDAAHAPAIR